MASMRSTSRCPCHETLLHPPMTKRVASSWCPSGKLAVVGVAGVAVFYAIFTWALDVPVESSRDRLRVALTAGYCMAWLHFAVVLAEKLSPRRRSHRWLFVLGMIFAAVVVTEIVRRAVGWHDPLGSELGELAHVSAIAAAGALLAPSSSSDRSVLTKESAKADRS